MKFFGFVLISLAYTASAQHADTLWSLPKDSVHTISGKVIYRFSKHNVIVFQAGMAIDADGSPHAYGPDNKGLDTLSHAGRPGHWAGIVVDTKGAPVVQQKTDPAPGMYVSPTSLVDSRYPETDPRRYVNAEIIYYIALPRWFADSLGFKLGDIAWVCNQKNGKNAYAVYADTGPVNKLGEGSIALAETLGLPNCSPRNGGVQTKDILYVLFPGSGNGNGKAVRNEEIAHKGKAALDSSLYSTVH